MEVQIKDKAREDDGNSQEVVLTIVASPEEVDAAVERFFADIAQRDIPGFRKGKAPREMLEQSVGGHANAMGGVAETLINEMAFEAIDEADVVFIEEPTFNVDQVPEPGKPFTFTVSGPVMPVMKLTDDGPVSVEMPPEKATEAEIEYQIQALRDFYHSFEPIDDPDHVAEMGDYVNLRLTVTNHDRPLPGLRAATRMVGLGEGTMPESFDEHILGTKVGDRLEFDFEAKDEEGNSEHGDGDLHAEVEVLGFRSLSLPDLDDDLAAKMGSPTVDDLYKQITYSINATKAKELPKLLVDRAVDALVERLDGDVPAYYVDFVRQDVGRELLQKLQDEGTDLQQWMINNAAKGDEVKDEIEQKALRRAAVDCALEAMFAAKGWEITEQDIENLFVDEEDPEGTLKQWKDAHRTADLRMMARRAKVSEWLADTADVTVVEED